MRLMIPESKIVEIKDKQNQKITLRPLTIEDAGDWYDFIMSCSKRTIYSRYNHAVQFSEDDIQRFCDINYDDEIAYIAEVRNKDEKKIVGEVRLYIFKNQPEVAEFAIIVADDWQSKGIGLAMTEAILSLGKERGLEKIIAYTESDNHKMLKIFKKLGFNRNAKTLDQTVDLTKLLKI